MMLPNSTFYAISKTDQEFIQGAISVQLETLSKASLYFNLDLDLNQIVPVIQKYLSYALKDCKPQNRMQAYLEISKEFTTLLLPNHVRESFRLVQTMELFRLAFDIELKLKNIKINIFSLQNLPLALEKQKRIWSDFRRDTSTLANYWSEKFYDSIIKEANQYNTFTKTSLDFRKTFEPLRSERKSQDSLYVTITAVAMILAGGKEEQPLSPILAIAKIYHEYLYYLNSIFDNKHGINPASNNYEEKVKDYSLASNLVISAIYSYLRGIKDAGFLNEAQYSQIAQLLEQTNIEITMIWFNDINGDVSQYFYQEYLPEQKTEILQMWINHAVQMTAVWTRFFSLMGAIAANQNYQGEVTKMVIEKYGELWGYGQIINGFKDFAVHDATADDVREKRCTPQLLHALFHSNPTEKQFIIDAINSASHQKRDLTPEEKQKFMAIFKRIGTFTILQGYIDRAILSFWSVYNSDNLLSHSLTQKNMNFTMQNLINGGLESWFKESRYLGQTK